MSSLVGRSFTLARAKGISVNNHCYIVEFGRSPSVTYIWSKHVLQVRGQPAQPSKVEYAVISDTYTGELVNKTSEQKLELTPLDKRIPSPFFA